MIVQLANDSLTTVVPPTLMTSCPLQVPFALALPVKVALTASPVLVLPVQLTVPDADLPSGLDLRSAVQSGPLANVIPASFKDVVIAASTELAKAVSRDFSIWPDALTVGLIRPRVELAPVLGDWAGFVAVGVGEMDGADVADEFDAATELVGLLVWPAWLPHAERSATAIRTDDPMISGEALMVISAGYSHIRPEESSTAHQSVSLVVTWRRCWPEAIARQPQPRQPFRPAGPQARRP